MYSTRPEDKFRLQLDEEEVLSFTLSTDYVAVLEKIFKYAHILPAVAADVTKAEEMFGISVSGIQKLGLLPVDAAKEAIRQAQVLGRLPTVPNQSRFEYPVIDHSTDNLLAGPSAAAPVAATIAPQIPVANSAISAATLAFSSEPEQPSQPMLSPEQEKADVEKRKKEREVKKAKAMEERENEAQQRKNIREQFEKDRAERLRQEEERRTKRAAEVQLATQNGTTNGSGATLAVPVAQTAASQSSSGPTSPSVSPRRPSPASAAVASEPVVQRSGHWATPVSSAKPAVEHVQRPIYVPPEELIYYTQTLRKLESERERSSQIIKSFEALSKVKNVPQMEDALLQWKRYAEAVEKDIVTISSVLRGESPNAASLVAPAEPVGFTLRDPSSSSMDIEEEDIEPKALTMTAAEPQWRVKVHLLTGPPVVVNLHPTHTIQDLYQHLASLAPFTNRYRLEIVGKPGELELTHTAEMAQLKMTTLRLIMR